MRAPSERIVVDAAILIAAVRGRSFGAVRDAARYISLATTARAVEEAKRRIELGLKQPELLPLLDALTDDMEVVPFDGLTPLLRDAERSLKSAVPSNNGSIKDAHLVALAWSLEADVWTTDRDFAGTGIASWSTPNLLRALPA